MSEIKVAIQLLCQQLNSLLKVDLKPENFRLAKFNNNDEYTIKQLWTTLLELSKTFGTTLPPENGYTIQFASQLFMLSRSYKCVEFYCLPWDNSSGSRELLLALMWIIASDNTLARLIYEFVRQSPLCQEYPEWLDEQPSECKLLSEEAKHKLNIESQLNYSLWLANRVKYNLNKIYDLSKERIEKTSKIHEGTRGASGLPHLSVFETKLVHDPEFLKQYMPGLLKLNELLDAHAKWIKKRTVFWDWMDTVVDLKEKEGSVTTSLQSYQEQSLDNFRQSLLSYTDSIKSESPMTLLSSLTNIPRFFMISSLMKSASTLVRKASSNDLLSEVETSDSGIVMQASDLLSCVNSNLQDIEQKKQDKINELHGYLHTISQKLGVIMINDTNNAETESEDCSK